VPDNNHLDQYAREVIVPIANPATAPALLKIATAVCHPEEGLVIALIISLGDSETSEKSIAALKPIIETFQEQTPHVELRVHNATSIARGILDVTREEAADLLVIGLRQPEHGQVVLGPVVENVVATAPCDVLIYRAAKKLDFERVVVWANGSQPSRVAAHIGIVLAGHQGATIEAMAVQSYGRSYYQGAARIEQTLAEVPGANFCKRTVITANNIASGLLTRLTDDDLLIIGFSRGSQLERWLFGDFARDLLNRAPGPVILTARSAEYFSVSERLRRRFGFFRPTLTAVEQSELVRQAEEMAASHLDYYVLIVLSAFLAGFGLLQNSAAVIIGAMLIAPLMQPLIGFAIGLTTGRFRLIQRSVLSAIEGIFLALLIAIVAGRIIPSSEPTAEMLARGSPSLLDAGVAFVSGLAGAYATARKDIPAALAGVAIAAALMPPVVTIGLGIALRDAELATGAALLFLANTIFISMAGWAVFFWLGMRPQLVEKSRSRLYTSLILVVVFAVIFVVTLLNLSGQAVANQQAIADELRDVFETADAVIVEIGRGEPMPIFVIVRDDTPVTPQDVSRAEQVLDNLVDGAFKLDVIFQQIIRSERQATEEVEPDGQSTATPGA